MKTKGNWGKYRSEDVLEDTASPKGQVGGSVCVTEVTQNGSRMTGRMRMKKGQMVVLGWDSVLVVFRENIGVPCYHTFTRPTGRKVSSADTDPLEIKESLGRGTGQSRVL
jgi:hypothetical protein